MRRIAVSFLCASAIGLSACYHAVIDTGRAVTGAPIVTAWAHSFIYGLVPPKVTETAKLCPGGVAKVETQQSFLNGLVGAITGGIYTPMQITVSCAGGRASIDGTQKLEVGAGDANAAMQHAVEMLRANGNTVLVQF